MSLDKLGGLVDKPTKPTLSSHVASDPVKTEVRVEYNEGARIPHHLVKLLEFIEMMSQKFNMKPDERSRRIIGQLSQQLGQQLENMSVQEFNSQIPFSLTFENGLFNYSSKELPVQIERYVAESNTSLVSVLDTDEQALKVIAAIYEEACKLAGTKRVFSDDAVHAQSNGTASIATLHFGISDVLSDALNAALKDTVGSDQSLFKRVGAMRKSEKSDESLQKYRTVVRLQEVELSIQKIDLVAGYSESCRLVISPRTKSDVGLGEYLVASEYDNKTHFMLVDALQSRLRDKAGK